MADVSLDSGVQRMLGVFAIPRDPPRRGLMLHEFVGAFGSDGWTMRDFKRASQIAFDTGLIELDAQFYRLTEAGRRRLRALAA